MLDHQELTWGKKQFEVLGGRFEPAQWEIFLKSWEWPKEPRWGIWEFVSNFTMNSGELPSVEQFPALERVELFGESGHLSARRDGANVLWHYVGQQRNNLPGTEFGAQSYWKTHPDEAFRRGEQKTALLWGEKSGDLWRDDRVGWAKLMYPGVDARRVKVKYWRFTRAGQVAFIWLTGMEDHPSEGK